MSRAQWLMPVAFGPTAYPPVASLHRNSATFTTVKIRFETSRTLIKNLLPPGVSKFDFENPGTVSICTLTHTALKGSSDQHSTISLYLHNVKYTAADGTATSGLYVPAMFDDLAEAVVRDREVLGLPKVYTKISHEHDTEQYHIRMESSGKTWASITLRNLKQTPPPQSAISSRAALTGNEDDNSIIAWRTMPIIQHKNSEQQSLQSEAFPVVAFWEESEKISVKERWTSTDVTVEFNSWDAQTLPTLHETAKRLAEIPIFRVFEADVLFGEGYPDFSHSIKLE